MWRKPQALCCSSSSSASLAALRLIVLTRVANACSRARPSSMSKISAALPDHSAASSFRRFELASSSSCHLAFFVSFAAAAAAFLARRLRAATHRLCAPWPAASPRRAGRRRSHLHRSLQHSRCARHDHGRGPDSRRQWSHPSGPGDELGHQRTGAGQSCECDHRPGSATGDP